MEKQENRPEVSRMILGLRSAGWDEKAIGDFILWVETGEEAFKPKENAVRHRSLEERAAPFGGELGPYTPFDPDTST